MPASSSPVAFATLSLNATHSDYARTGELALDNGTYMAIEAHKRLDLVRMHRGVGIDGAEMGSTWFLPRAEARAIALELLAAVDAVDSPLGLDLSQDDVRYALSRSVPDMARGFAIQTSYGDLRISDGPLAARLQAILQNAFMAALEVEAEAQAA